MPELKLKLWRPISLSPFIILSAIAPPSHPQHQNLRFAKQGLVTLVLSSLCNQSLPLHSITKFRRHPAPKTPRSLRLPRLATPISHSGPPPSAAAVIPRRRYEASPTKAPIISQTTRVTLAACSDRSDNLPPDSILRRTSGHFSINFDNVE